MNLQESPHIEKIARELNLRQNQVRVTAVLLAEGATIPFIARYRKEMTGSLDEVAVAEVRDRLQRMEALEKRRESILSSLEERSLLTESLARQISSADTLTLLEDLYMPFRPRRRTRATVAREKGLAPLAERLFSGQEETAFDPGMEAKRFVDLEKDVPDVLEALAGARDILAEKMSEDLQARDRVRSIFRSEAILESHAGQKADIENSKFKDYFEYKEPVTRAPSHRLLAIFRGEREGELRPKIAPEEKRVLPILFSMFVKGNNLAAQEVATAVEDGYRRLMAPSMETELRKELKERADEEAIRVFAENLRELLLAPPLGRKRVFAMDPAFRTGCKWVLLDSQGKLLHHGILYPHGGRVQREEAKETLQSLCGEYGVEAIAIGNGTACRETEAFVLSCELPQEIPVVMVNESGASVYSASEIAREEFPDLDLTVRGAVSIGRRLLDPLAELVKIDPKSIGVGQYQHDVDQSGLKRRLDEVVQSCVNAVGVDLNTASKHLLMYVSGLGPSLAENIVTYRNQQGPFSSRKELLKVPRLGPKAFEQSAGFLRIREGLHPLDASAVHPESYWVVEAMARDLGCSIGELMREETRREGIRVADYISKGIGEPTLEDILGELSKPGRDPRSSFEVFSFQAGVHEVEHLKIGMELPGIITNVTHFGAFVDIGVHQDGLVHISQLADRFVRDPSKIVKVNQRVNVTVIEVDAARKRIALSMRKDPWGGMGGKASGKPMRAKDSGGTSRRTGPDSWKGSSLGDVLRFSSRLD